MKRSARSRIPLCVGAQHRRPYQQQDDNLGWARRTSTALSPSRIIVEDALAWLHSWAKAA